MKKTNKDFFDLIDISQDDDDYFVSSSIKKCLDYNCDNKKNVKTIFISDKNIWHNCQKYFSEILYYYKIDVFLLDNATADEFYLHQLLDKARNYDFIIALGSGTINDLCKIVAIKLNISFFIFASAASMNGYLSQNSSIKINGHKKTISGKLPEKVFCDLNILAKAPKSLIKAGIGDSMCFYSCFFDWYLAFKLCNYDFNYDMFLLLKDKMSDFVNNYNNFDISDTRLCKKVIEILLISGIGMTLCGSSSPASQSEHLIAHTIDMKYPQIAKKNLHGQIIAVTTIYSVELQQQILQNFFIYYQKLTNRIQPDYQKRIINFFGNKAALECIEEYDCKLERIKSLNKITKNDIEDITDNLNKFFLSSQKIKQIFNHFNISTNCQSLGLDDIKYIECANYAKFIRNRFTCLDLT